MRHRWTAPILALAALALIPAPVPAASRAIGVGRATLADIPLATVQGSRFPIANDRGILLGGIGSDLWHGPSDPINEFWMVADRGPNGQIAVDGVQRRTFPTPEFTPHILRVRTVGTAMLIADAIPIVGQSGRPVTGISNTAADEPPYDWSATQRLPLNPSGLDTEGMVRTSRGEFWLSDEYSPSILRVGPDGRVIVRYVPEGVDLAGADYPVEPTLPAIYSKRRGNRGFEGIALSRDERTVYVVLQSPLRNPTAAIGDASRNTRVLAVDTASGLPVAEYVYRFDPSSEFQGVPDDMKLSAVVVVNPTTLLILERTDFIAKLYLVDLTQATNILGSRWDDAATSPSLEGTADLAAAGVRVLPKRLLIDLDTIPDMPDKIEGVAIVTPNIIAVANDNDFQVGDFDATGRIVGTGTRSNILYIALDEPLPVG